MPISERTRHHLVSSLADIEAAEEVITAIDGGGAADATEHYVTAADAGSHNILGSADVPRVVIVVVTITESYTAGDGTEPTLEIGASSDLSSFAAASKFAGAVAGTTIVCAGLLPAGDSLEATGVAGTGTATGAATVDAMTVGVGHVDEVAAAAAQRRLDQRATDQDTAIERAFVAGTLPEEDRRGEAQSPPKRRR